jgi:hypothetical protein
MWPYQLKSNWYFSCRTVKERDSVLYDMAAARQLLVGRQIIMHIFPDEYKPHIRQYHVWAVVFSCVLILVGIVALVVLMVGPSDIVNGLVKKIFGGLVVFGIPVGAILLTLIISVVNYRHNKSRRESLRAKESAIFSVTQRAKVISAIKHVKYDYRNSNNIWIKAALLLISFLP